MSDPLKNFDTLPDSAHVKLPALMALYAASPSTIRRYVIIGRIPKPVTHFNRAVCWNVGELRRSLAKAVAR